MPRPTSRVRARVLLAGSALLALGAFACSDDEETITTPTPPTFTTTLNGANERPNAVATPATGTAKVVVNGTTATYEVTVTGLTGAPRFAHIHAPGDANTSVGVVVNFNAATVTGTTGTFSGTFTAADIQGISGRAPFSMDSLVTLMKTGNAYVNVHTAQFGGGEIRGQLSGK